MLFFDPREPMIPAMSAQSVSQLDQFAREESSLKTQRPTPIPIQMQAEQKKPVKASIQVGVRLRQDYIEDLQRMADELFALGEIPEATVPQMIRYCIRFFGYNYTRWIRPYLIQTLRQPVNWAANRSSEDQVNSLGRELDSMSGGSAF